MLTKVAIRMENPDLESAIDWVMDASSGYQEEFGVDVNAPDFLEELLSF